MDTLEKALDATNTATSPSRESTSDEETWPDEDNYFDESDDSGTPQYQVEEIDGDAPPQTNMGEGDAPPETLTCEDDLPYTAGDKVRSGMGELAPQPTQEGDVPPTAGDKVLSGIGENSPEHTHEGDAPPQPTRETTAEQREQARPRLQTDTRDDHLDQSDETQPGPSGTRPPTFAAMPAASRAGQSNGKPGHATQVDAHPTHTPPLHQYDTDDEPECSPLKTRGGTVRGPPPSPKRRKPRPN